MRTVSHLALASVSSAALALGLVAGAGAAQAGPPRNLEHYSGAFSFTECDDAYGVEGTFSGHVVVIDSNPSMSGQFFRVVDEFRFTETWTNVETGRTATVEANVVFREVRPRTTDGQVFSYTGLESGTWTFRDDSGDVAYRERGLVEFSAVFDSLGDGEPGGEILSFDLVRFAGPHPVIDRDICEVMDELTA